MMAANTETLHDVLAHQVDLCVEVFSADDGVDGLKQFLVHCKFLISVCKIKQKLTDSEENICTHLGHVPNACIENDSFCKF